MRKFKKRFVFALLLMVVGIASCGGGSDSPTTPSGPVNVSGLWNFDGRLTRDTCYDLTPGSRFTASITFFQSGSTVTTRQVDITIGGMNMFFTYRGRVTGNNLSMAAVDPYVWQDGGSVIHLGSGIDIQNIRNNAGSGSYNLTGQCIQGCTGSCQTIWTGTWTK